MAMCLKSQHVSDEEESYVELKQIHWKLVKQMADPKPMESISCGNAKNGNCKDKGEHKEKLSTIYQ